MVLPLGDLEKTRIVPLATYVLIALNVVMYLYQLESGRSFTVSYAATPYEISHNVDLHWIDDEAMVIPAEEGEGPFGNDGPAGRVAGQELVPFPIWVTLFTAMFLHGSPLHLAGNMLYLWIFGDNVEEVLGRPRYLLFYLLGGVLGTLLQISADPDSTVPILGASGAIAGVMGAYVVWFPENQVRVLVFRFVTQMPALLVIGFWIILQLVSGFGSIGRAGGGGGVAYLAHIGGAATGIAVGLLYRDRARALKSRIDPNEGWFVGP